MDATLLHCPRCRKRLKQNPATLVCVSCKNTYPVKRGIPYLLPQYQKAPPVVMGMNSSLPGTFGTGFRTLPLRLPGRKAEESSPQLEPAESDGHYRFGGVDVFALTQKLPTPFFLFSQDVLTCNALGFKNTFSSGGIDTKLYYSLKTCYEKPVVTTLQKLGYGAEVASGMELALALKLGFAPADIIFDSPAKTEAELAAAIRANVRLINIDNLDEVKRLIAVLPKSKTVRIGVRVTSPFVNPLSVNLGQTRFGLPPDIIYKDVTKLIKNHPQISLIGLSAHVGSQLPSSKPFVDLVRNLLEVRYKLTQAGFMINEINIGGGFPSPKLRPGYVKIIFDLFRGYFSQETNTNQIILRINEAFKKNTINDNRILLAAEPGRSLVSSSAVLVTRVLSTKGGWLATDASTNYLSEPDYFVKRPVYHLVTPDSQPRFRYHVGGATLGSTDVLAYRALLPEVRTDDFLVIEEAGAYSLSRAARFSHPVAPAYWISRDNRIMKIRNT